MSHRVAVGRSVVSSGGTAAKGARMASTNARADCAVSLDSDASRGPLGGIRKVDVQGVPRRSVHRVAVVDRRGAKREPAVASVAATRDRRLLTRVAPGVIWRRGGGRGSRARGVAAGKIRG